MTRGQWVAWSHPWVHAESCLSSVAARSIMFSWTSRFQYHAFLLGCQQQMKGLLFVAHAGIVSSAGSIRQGWPRRGPRYAEVDIDVGSSSVAAAVVGLVQGATRSLVVDIGIVLEGHTREELPEALLGTVRVSTSWASCYRPVCLFEGLWSFMAGATETRRVCVRVPILAIQSHFPRT